MTKLWTLSQLIHWSYFLKLKHIWNIQYFMTYQLDPVSRQEFQNYSIRTNINIAVLLLKRSILKVTEIILIELNINILNIAYKGPWTDQIWAFDLSVRLTISPPEVWYSLPNVCPRYKIIWRRGFSSGDLGSVEYPFMATCLGLFWPGITSYVPISGIK